MSNPRRGAPLVVVAIAAMILTLLPVGAQAGTASGPWAGDDVQFVNLINRERQAAGLPLLATHLQLTRIARAHAAAMARADDAGGSCGDGHTLHHRSPLDGGITASWYTLRENVGCTGGGGVPALHDAFMASPGHRENILAGDVTFVGVGTWRAGDGTIWVTELFMRGGQAPRLAIIDEGIAASQTSHPAGSRPDYVVLSRSDVYADSLSGAALAGGRSPILFTDGPTGEEPDPVLRPRTRAEIDRLLAGSGRVYLLGGTDAVSSRAEQELRGAGYNVRRLSGPTRVETSIAVAQEVVHRFGQPAVIAVASADAWPDAVTGGAAAAHAGVPLVLTYRDRLPAATRGFLSRYADADHVVLGGAAAVSDPVTSTLHARRLAGPSRAETALAVADGFFGPAGDAVVVAEGYGDEAWGRTLAWSPYAAERGAPQIIVGDSVPPTVARWLTEHRGQLRPKFTGGLSVAVRQQVESLLR